MNTPALRTGIKLLALGRPADEVALLEEVAHDPKQIAAGRAELVRLAKASKLSPDNLAKWFSLLVEFGPQLVAFFKAAKAAAGS